MDGLFVAPDKRVGLTVRDLNVSIGAGSGKSRTKKGTRTSWFGVKRAGADKSDNDNNNENNNDNESDIDNDNGNADNGTNRNDKKVIDNVSFDLEPGQVLVILGASGCGKTTLLNTLSSRMNFSKSHKNPFRFSGTVQYTQIEPNMAYLLQEDLFMPGLTVREILKFTADLRLHSLSETEKNELIDYLIEELNIVKIKHTKINDFKYRSTLSGGEKRRVSLAIQLLTKPSIFFLDEPTTGLDSNTSIKLIQIVKHLAKDFGITIILTIHQPRFEILEIIDKILVLAKGGRMIFYGSLTQGQEYFKNLSSSDDKMSSNLNFADFLLDISSIDKTNSKELELMTLKRVEKLVQDWKIHSNSNKSIQEKDKQLIDSFAQGDELFPIKKNNIPFLKEIVVLSRRCFLLTTRDLQSFIMLLGVGTILSVICGWMFFKPGMSLSSIRSITSSLYVCCEVIGFTPMLYEIERLTNTDGKFLVREYKDGMYSITGFFIARKLTKAILEDIPISMIWSLVTYYMWGLDGFNGKSNFGIYFINNLFIYMIGITNAMLCFVLGDYTFAIASLLSSVFYQLQNVACGYFINAKTMPVYVRWLKYLSNFWYNFGSLVSNHFTNFSGDCPYEDLSLCNEYQGEYILKQLGYPKNWFALPLCVSICWFLGYYIFAGILIWYKSEKNIVKIVKPKSTPASEIFQNFNNYNENLLNELKVQSKGNGKFENPVTINISNINIILKSSLFAKLRSNRGNEEKKILSNVNAVFKPGVNAIMGPSGSGKTTLLNYLTGRTRLKSLKIEGEMYLNSNKVPFNLLNKITSYVVQDDSFLISKLTVRETLVYQAQLRLSEDRMPYLNEIVNGLIKKMGLIDVENIPIGDNYVKGISGGEKRRVSIAIQLLNDSNILLLDEPTSGLDSFTSSNLLNLLHEISVTENKTVILTIHQPKWEIFNKFDNILLLGQGETIYNGGIFELIEYFKTLGFKPNDEEMNFADYLLDLLSQKESLTTLTNSWKLKEGAPYSNYNDINNHMNGDAKFDFTKLIHKRQHYFVALKVLINRQLKIYFRSSEILLARVGQAMVLSIIYGLFFAPIGNSSESILNRLGLIQEILNMYFVGLINNFSVYTVEKWTFYNEYGDNVYSPLAFSTSYFFTELPFELFASFFLSIFSVLVVGLPRTGKMFFTMFYLCIVGMNTGESIGTIFNTIFDHLGLAMNIISNLIIVAIFMGGTMSLNMPILFRAFNYISPLKWQVLALAKLGFQHETFRCIDDSKSCILNTGSAVLKQYGLESNYAVDMIAVSIIFVVYRILAHCLLEMKLRLG